MKTIFTIIIIALFIKLNAQTSISSIFSTPTIEKHLKQENDLVNLDSVVLQNLYNGDYYYGTGHTENADNGRIQKINKHLTNESNLNDIRVEENTYDKAGNIIENILKLPEFKISYSQSNELIVYQQEKSTFENDLITDYYRYTYSNFTPYELNEKYIYNEDNQLIKIDSRYPENFTYDSQGQLKYETTNSGTFVYANYFTYKKDGNMTVIQCSTARGDSLDVDTVTNWIINYEETLQFNSKGQLEEYTYTFLGDEDFRLFYVDVYFPDFKVFFEYTEDNKLLKANYYTIENNIENEVYRVLNEYNGQGNILKHKTTFYNSFYNTWDIETLEEYYYNSKKVSINSHQKGTIPLYPNPATNIIHVEAPPNTPFQILRNNGAVVYSGDEILNQVLNIDHLEEGSYILKIISNGNLEGIPFIKVKE